MNFSAKLLAGSLAVLFLSAISAMAYTYQRSKLILREEFVIEADAAAANVAELLKPIQKDQAAMCRFAIQVLKTNDLAYIQFLRSGKIICSAGDIPKIDFSLANPILAQETVEATRTYTTFASSDCQGANCKPIDIEIGIGFGHLENELNLMRKNILWNNLVQIFSASIFLLIFSYVVRRRLDLLAKACESISNGNLDLNLDSRGSDEISRIARAMNGMAREIKNAELEKEKQQQVNQYTAKMTALGEMAAGVAHEINNPLMIISGNIENAMAKIEAQKFSSNDALGTLKKIQDTTNRISKIVSGLRSFSRNGEKDPQQPTKLSKIIFDTLGLCSEKFRKNGVNIEVSEAPEINIDCRGVQISQVILNLLNNSFDAIEDLPEKWIKLSFSTENGQVKIRIIDSGLGIRPEIVNKIVQPFFTTKAIGKGTGLGLSVSVGIAVDHGGSLTYELFEGHTSFVLKLPISKRAEKIA